MADTDMLNKYNIKDYIEIIGNLTSEELFILKANLDNRYYNEGDSGLTDERYDIIIEKIHNLNPVWVKPVGTKIRGDDIDATLPVWLGSLDTYKPSNEDKIVNWFNKYKSDNYVVEDKLDGTSCLICYYPSGENPSGENPSGEIKLYTRGDGKIGKDISYIAPYISSIPKKLSENYGSLKKPMLIRGELIMKTAIFEKKYSKRYETVRAMIPGILRSKEMVEPLPDIDFVAYEIIDSSEKIQHIPSDQIFLLRILGFKVVKNQVVSRSEIVDKIIMENMSILFHTHKEQSEYGIDGIVVHVNDSYTRNESRNPKYSFAYKEDSEIAIARVLKVEWKLSRYGYYKPTVIIEPTRLMNTTVSRATAFNASYVKENALGPGARIKITKSGEVIPYIMEVTKPSSAGPQMPNDPNANWNDTNTDLIASSEMCNNNNSCIIESTVFFFSIMRIKFLGKSTIERLYKAGYTTIPQIIKITQKQLLEVEGIKLNGATRILTNIKNGMESVSISRLLAASAIFGRGMGEKKLELIFNKYPNILNMDDQVNLIQNIKGFSSISVDLFMSGISKAQKFLSDINYVYDIISIDDIISTDNDIISRDDKVSASLEKILEKKSIVLSGFRDQELENKIKNNGGKVSSSVSGNTHCVVTKSANVSSSKVKKAIELNVEIITIENFLKKYSI